MADAVLDRLAEGASWKDARAELVAGVGIPGAVPSVRSLYRWVSDLEAERQKLSETVNCETSSDA